MASLVITAHEILAALCDSNEGAHPASQAYIDGDVITEVILDGRFDLEDVARILSERLQPQLA